ncbi:YqjD family protein [Pasteurella multocida]|nr:YqjD family protein [Pasteurella multocida]URH92584.1 YqjD family protein [Pasteurella multocida]
MHNSPAENHANPAPTLTLRNFFHAKFFSFNYANIVTTSQEFDKKRDELLSEIREILDNAEELFDEKSKASVDELKKLKSNLDSRVSKLQKQFGALKDDAVAGTKEVIKQTDELVQDNPYKAIGVAGVIGLLLGVLISKK